MQFVQFLCKSRRPRQSSTQPITRSCVRLKWILVLTLVTQAQLLRWSLTQVAQLMSRVFMAIWASLKASQLAHATLQLTIQSCRRLSLGFFISASILEVRWRNPSSIQTNFEQMDLLSTCAPSNIQMGSHCMASTMRRMTCTFCFKCMDAWATFLHGYPLKRRS